MAGCLFAATNRGVTSPDLNRSQSSLKRKRTADSAALFLLANKQAQQQSKLDSKCKFLFLFSTHPFFFLFLSFHIFINN